MLEAFLQSLSCVFMLTLLTGAGYWTASRGWYDQTASQLLVRLVNFLSLPCFLFSSVMEKMTHDDLFALFEPMIVPFISIWLVFFASRIFVRIFRIDSLHSGVFCAFRNRRHRAYSSLLLREHNLLLDHGQLS